MEQTRRGAPQTQSSPAPDSNDAAAHHSAAILLGATPNAAQLSAFMLLRSRVDTARIDAVLAETETRTGNFASEWRMSPAEALIGGLRFLGRDYTEIGKPGSCVFRSADGLRQFRMDKNSLLGAHPPGEPHVHFEIYTPGARIPLANNHVILEGERL
jgi:hypothetical protein